MVKDIYPGTRTSSYPRYLTNVNGTLYFTANDGRTALSSGRATGRRPAPSWSRTSARAAAIRIPAISPT